MKEILDITKEKMGKCVNALESELATIRAGRANPSVLDRITVDYYGCPTPVNQMASISVSEARILVVQPFDASTLKSIEKAIQASDLGINPTNDGRVLRIAFPQLTEDRRKELCKQVRSARKAKLQSATYAATLSTSSRQRRRTVRSPRTTSRKLRRMFRRSPTSISRPSTLSALTRTRRSCLSDG